MVQIRGVPNDWERHIFHLDTFEKEALASGRADRLSISQRFLGFDGPIKDFRTPQLKFCIESG